jgi:fatty-acyl-CoA synthase
MLGKLLCRKFSITANKELAYVSGSSTISQADGTYRDVTLISDNISQALRKQAVKYAKNPFQVFCQKGVSYTYEEFDQRVDEIAKGFIALGLEKGDRIGIYSPNRPEWALTQYAAARADLILVNVNPAFQHHDLKYSLNLVGIKALVMPEKFSHSHYVNIVRHIVPELGEPLYLIIIL